MSPAGPDREAIVAKLIADLIEAIALLDSSAAARFEALAAKLDAGRELRVRFEPARLYLVTGLAVGLAAGLLMNGVLR